MLGKLPPLLDLGALPLAVYKNRTLLRQLVRRNIAVRYRGAMLGLVWSFVQPLMMLCVYTFVFSVIFKARWGVDVGGGRGAFAIVMFCGMALFNIFSESIGNSCRVVADNPNFVKKVIFPLEMLPVAQTLSTLLLGMVWFVLLFFGTALIFGRIGFTMLLLPLILLPLFMFTLGAAFFVSSFGAYLRDTAYIVQVALQILFFMTPIFYPIQAVPEQFRWPLRLNPLAILIEEARKVFVYGELPNWKFLAAAFLVSLVVMQLGYVWFEKTKKGFADVL